VNWFALRVESPHERELIIAALIDAGAPGVHEDGTALLTHYESESAARRAAATVTGMESDAVMRIESVADVDWTTAWRHQMRAFSLGALTIAPPWLADGLKPAHAVVIDPGMAFGTGDHASTRGAVRLMQTVIRPGDVVADLGTGSAVLAIAAAKLGAGRVVGVDLDPDALGNARENVERNGVGNVVHLLDGDAATLLPLIAPVDVIVANITANVLHGLLPAMSGAVNDAGRAVVAGILEAEGGDFVNAAIAHGWTLVRAGREEGWWSALFERR
jgi:ribosomal protein L11 methyltransferase